MPPLIAILAWPVISVIFFQKLRLPLAILVTFIAGYLLLPENTAVDLPLLPALDKFTVPALSAVVLAGFLSQRDRGRKLPGLLPRHWLFLLILALIVSGAFITVMKNPDPLVYELRFLRGLRLYDAFSNVLGVVMTLLPMVLARKYLAHPENHTLILLALCIGGLVYSLPALFEIRMSPQLNSWIYGFFPHDWRQHVREGGFRPLVFLQHGLLLAIFLSATIFATLALSRVKPEKRGIFLLAAVWLLGTLVLSKSLGALFITLALMPAVFILGVRGQLLVAALIAGLFLSYPIVRSSHVIPLDRIESAAQSISVDRAASLRTRLENEDRMLAKASERPLFGWGGSGRWRVFDERGRDITLSDGYWTLVLSEGGWARYLALFGLLTVPIFLLWFNCRRYRVEMQTAALALILAGNLVDLIPNTSITPITWLIAGALWGRVELKDQATAVAPTEDLPPQPSRYSRHFPDRDGAQPLPPAAARSKTVYTRQKEQIYRRGQSTE